MNIIKKASKPRNLFWSSWLMAVSVMLAAGFLCRYATSHLKFLMDKPIILDVPLKTFPIQIGNWRGKDVPIPNYIQRIASNDDFLYRFYEQKGSGQWVSLYITYSCRPRTMLGHRPQVCYVAMGWVYENTEQSQFIDYAGKPIPYLIHRFHKAGSNYQEIVVLNFYVLNGKIICNEKGFSGIEWRTPNLAGNPARYIAQIQISSSLENSVRAAAEDMTELLLDFLPDENGKVNALDYVKNTSLKNGV